MESGNLFRMKRLNKSLIQAVSLTEKYVKKDEIGKACEKIIQKAVKYWEDVKYIR